MKALYPFTLLAALTTLPGCSTPSAPTASAWDTPLPPLSAQPTTHCNKRGCHEHKPMIFDPTQNEPDATTLHRGW
ncbi:hypothetical protein D3C77_82480 [compost metagenome]|uniref:hypothetical protein n=1 Tax=Pseudomonas TaxID=286 RepID=UPI0004096268|nr:MULTISPECIES: hypothetical protein [Pseudomonas]MCW2269235.1 hypothetical protein [Pseudomonas sp. JUb96]PRA70199.1 hypothetical protein CQ065_05825 [Pseudomonas sp. MYb187]